MSDATIKNGPEGHVAAAQLEGIPPEELYKAGGQYLKARDYISARSCLEKYLEQRPDDPAALHLLARALYHLNKDFDKAEECLNRAASLDPVSLTSYLETLGILLIHQAKYVRAREVFEYALSQDKQKNTRHTAALKFYLDLAKKKSAPNRPRIPKSHKPRSLFFTADYGHTRMKAYFFVLPSIMVHALILLLMMYLSVHHMPFKKDIAAFTFVEIQQPAGEAPPPEEARPVGEKPRQAAPEASPEEQAPASPPSQAGAEAGLKLPTVPATVSPQVQPKVAGMQMESPKAPAAPEIKERESGAGGAVGAKSKAAELAMKPGDIEAVSAIPGSNRLKIQDVRPGLDDGEVKLSKKTLTALSGGAGVTPEKRYQAEKLRNKASALARGTMGPSLASGGGPAWEKKRLAKLEEQDFKAAREKLAEAKKFDITTPAIAPLQDDIKNFPARQLKIDAGNFRQDAASGKIPRLKSLNDMRDNISAYEKMQENLGAPMPSRAQEMAAPSKARASLGKGAIPDQPKLLSGTDKMPAPADSLTGRRFASVKALPGKSRLQMPGQKAVSSSMPRAGIAKLDEKSSTALAGYASSGITQAAGGGYAGIAKGASGKALGPAASEGGLGGLIESASRKMADALGFGQSAVPSGPSAGDLKRGGVADLQPAPRPGAGNGGGTGGGVRGAVAGGVHFESAPKPSALLSEKGPAGGGKQFAGSSLEVPLENRYASARVEAALMSADRRSAVTRGTLIAKNTVGLQVRISTPYSGNTNMISQTVTGNVSDRRVKKATLTVNGDSRVISCEDGAFEASACLSKGRNMITVMAFDPDGNIAKDSVEIYYSEPSDDTPVNIIYPKNGQVFDVSEKSVITVKGTIGDLGIKRAKLIFDGNPLDIEVDKGYFEKKVALEQEQNTIVVEATNSSGTSHSQTVNVSTVNLKPKDIMIILSWDKPHADFDLHVYSPSGKDTYSKNPNTKESKAAIPTGGQLEQDVKGNFGPEVFDERYAEHGVYTVKSNYYSSGGDGNANAKVRIILYGDNPSRRIVRVFGPHLQLDKNGSDTWEVTRFRMPEGIFLEE